MDPLQIPQEVMRHKKAIIAAHERFVKKSKRNLTTAERIAWLANAEIVFEGYERRGFLSAMDGNALLASIATYLKDLPSENPDWDTIYAFAVELKQRMRL